MLAAAQLTAPPGSPVLAKYHQRKIDFLGETALFGIFTDFNLHVRVFGEDEIPADNSAAGRNLPNIWILSYKRNKPNECRQQLS